jgi:hypothetical protein
LQSAVAFAFAVALALLVVIPEGDLLLLLPVARSSSNQKLCHPALSVVEWVPQMPASPCDFSAKRVPRRFRVTKTEGKGGNRL